MSTSGVLIQDKNLKPSVHCHTLDWNKDMLSAHCLTIESPLKEWYISVTFFNKTKWPRQVVHLLILDSDPEILYFWRFERKRREKGGNTLQGKYYVCGGNEERRKKEGKHLKKENIFFCGCLDV